MNDTLKLMKESCRGCKYALETIKIARGYTKDKELMQVLDESIRSHEALQSRISKKIRERGAEEHSHQKIGATMARLHTNMSLTMNPSSKKVAELMINGCNMGIKTLSKEKNKDRFADREARELTDGVIASEQKMASELLRFL